MILILLIIKSTSDDTISRLFRVKSVGSFEASFINSMGQKNSCKAEISFDFYKLNLAVGSKG